MSRPKQGFTLIEMLMAIAISAIACALAGGLWLSLHNTILQRQKYGLENIGNQASFLAVQGRINKAERFLFLDEDELIWETQNHTQDTLLWADDSLYLNGKVAMPLGLSQVQFNAYGPSWNPDSGANFEDWRRLDQDRNGNLDAKELDADYSRSLDAVEIQMMTLLEIKLIAEDGNHYFIRRAKR